MVRFCVLPGFWPRWALSWPESCVAVPATLVFGLGCLQRGRGARKTQKRAILRYTRVLAALGSVVAGILHSCSGYVGFWPWLLAAGPPRGAAGCSAGSLALCWFLGCWLLWWVGCCLCGYTLEHRMTDWISQKNQD